MSKDRTKDVSSMKKHLLQANCSGSWCIILQRSSSATKLIKTAFWDVYLFVCWLQFIRFKMSSSIYLTSTIYRPFCIIIPWNNLRKGCSHHLLTIHHHVFSDFLIQEICNELVPYCKWTNILQPTSKDFDVSFHHRDISSPF